MSLNNNAATQVRSEDAAPYNVPKPPAPQHFIRADDERLILEAAGKILERQLERSESLTAPSAAGKLIRTKLHGRPAEVFVVLFLDTRHRLIAYEEMFFGSVDGCEVHPREVVRSALAHNAAALIVGHNHPSGCNDPSAADRAVTARLKQSLALIDVRLLDHFVVGDGSAPVSLAARGWV